MARIKCRTPSTGKGIRVSSTNVSTIYQTIAEANDFSVPDAAGNQPVRDPLDSANRAIRAGELFFLTPLSAKNKSSGFAWIEVRVLDENGVTLELGRINVPPGDTAFIPLQGRSLFKRDAITGNGDRLQVRAQISNIFDVWAAAEEKLSSEHVGEES
jgi:hypothetical protein